jgi:hypothetical protein
MAVSVNVAVLVPESSSRSKVQLQLHRDKYSYVWPTSVSIWRNSDAVDYCDKSHYLVGTSMYKYVYR